MIKRTLTSFLLCLILLVVLCAQQPQLSPILKTMRRELQHSLDALKTQPIPPYFLSYTITDLQRTSIEASFGALEVSQESHRRQLALDLRVGNYNLDNSHEIRGSFSGFESRYSNIEIPVEDDPDAIRTILWLETDKRYKKALERYTKVLTNKAVKVKEEDPSDDFSHEQTETYIDQLIRLSIDRATWDARLKKITEPFRAHPHIYDAHARFEALVETKYFVSSEGTNLQTSTPYVRLLINAFSKADDGTVLPRYESFFSFSPEGIPSDEVILSKVEKMITDLENLRIAPITDPYTGPAILRGGATGVFFHEVFGHRVEGHRQKSEFEGQTFKKMIGQQLLPTSISVHFDPTLERAGGKDLSGHYKYDDEGVKTQRVTVIENGIFKNFLMSRSPIEKFQQSNGHGRCQAGFQPVARQSNLIVEASEPISLTKLRQMLIDQCKQQNKPYGLLFEQIQGGFTITGRMIPNSFNVLPLVVYRVYTDGRTDELVRGVDLVGTPLTAFSKVVAAGDDPETWYGYCRAESGGVPVSQTCPSILISQIEVQKKFKSQEKPPVLDAPSEKKP